MITNKDLKGLFNIINKKFFYDNLSDTYKVRFSDIKEDGLCTGEEILINKDLKYHPDLAIMVLIHEMAHASLPGYTGWEDAHGLRFQAAINDLYMRGAYDGLL